MKSTLNIFRYYPIPLRHICSIHNSDTSQTRRKNETNMEILISVFSQRKQIMHQVLSLQIHYICGKFNNKI